MYTTRKYVNGIPVFFARLDVHPKILLSGRLAFLKEAFSIIDSNNVYVYMRPPAPGENPVWFATNLCLDTKIRVETIEHNGVVQYHASKWLRKFVNIPTFMKREENGTFTVPSEDIYVFHVQDTIKKVIEHVRGNRSYDDVFDEMCKPSDLLYDGFVKYVTSHPYDSVGSLVNVFLSTRKK